MSPRFSIFPALSLLLLTGCMVGPKYIKPTVPMAPGSSAASPDAYKENSNWQPATPQDATLRGDWWTIFHDAGLNQLEPQVALSNQNLIAAEARFREARSLIQYNKSFLAPTIAIAPYAGGERFSANQPYFNSNLISSGTGNIQLPIDLNYEVDLWGRIRHSVHAAREEAQASAGDTQTALLSLQAELAVDYFEARTADAEEQLLQATVRDYQDALNITTNRFEGGVSPESDVDQAKAQLQAAEVQASEFDITRSQYEHAVAVLLGRPPASFSLPIAPLDAQAPQIPTGLPSQLLERRPDIAAAERRMAEANDRIGIAKAAYYPMLTIGALTGFAGTNITNVLSASSYLWSLGPTATETVFDYGRRHSITEQAYATYDETVANYRQTTLTAFQQVEDNLVALRVLEREAEQQHQATQAAVAAEKIFNNRYVGGIDNYLNVVTAQTTTLVNQRNDIDIMRRQMDASVLLIKALGGGWNVTQLPKL